jgi:hypothetical protein
MKNRLLGVTAFLVFAATSAVGTDAQVERPSRSVHNQQAIQASTNSACGDAREFLKNRLLYLEKEIRVQYHQRKAWQAFSDAALVAQNSFESACSEDANPGDLVEGATRSDRTFPTASDTLQSFDHAAKTFVDVLTQAQRQKLSEALWLIVRSELNNKRSEFECCADQQFIVAMLVSVAQVPHAKV